MKIKKPDYKSRIDSRIEKALKYAGPNGWDFGNGILYSMCRQNPFHDRPEIVVGKVWLIGRSYAAAIERGRKKSKESSDKFYEKIVTKYLSKSFDTHLAKLDRDIPDCRQAQKVAVEIHYELLLRFKKMVGGMNKRSLASKYLHFHRPDVFFIKEMN